LPSVIPATDGKAEADVCNDIDGEDSEDEEEAEDKQGAEEEVEEGDGGSESECVDEDENDESYFEDDPMHVSPLLPSGDDSAED
jgi:hypothetical protein